MPYWRLSAIYFSYFTIVGAITPFWGLYLQSLGFNAVKIGVLAAIPLVVRLVVPNFWGYVADKNGRRVRLLRMGAFGSLVTFSFLLVVRDFYTMALAMAAYSFFWNAIMGQTETITINCLKDRFARYGRIRLWGSLGFIASVLYLGWFFDYFSIDYLPRIIEVLLVVLLAAACLLRSNIEPRHRQGKHFDDFFTVLRLKAVWVFFVATFMLHASHGAYYVFYSIYLESSGYTRLEIGVFWTIGVLAEIVLFIYMHKLLAKFSLWCLFVVSLGLTALRWLGIAFFVDHPVLLVLMQLLHAFSFGVSHAVAIEFCRRRFSSGMLSRGQAFYSSVSFGAGSAFGALVSGFMWGISGEFTFVFAAVMVFAGLFLVLIALNASQNFKQNTTPSHQVW